MARNHTVKQGASGLATILRQAMFNPSNPTQVSDTAVSVGTALKADEKLISKALEKKHDHLLKDLTGIEVKVVSSKAKEDSSKKKEGDSSGFKEPKGKEMISLRM